jgi:hypothetical protein
MNLLEKELANIALKRGGIFFLTGNNAVYFIEKCRENKRKILGIDSFIITENITQPVLEESIDYTCSVYKTIGDPNIWDTAISFIKARLNKEYMFEVVYE